MAERCALCHDVGWILEPKGDLVDGVFVPREPVTLELLKCLIPDCEASGRPIEHLSVNWAGFKARPDIVPRRRAAV